MKLKILDLFSGLGGFSLGLERTGNFETIAFCDNDKYSNLVLQKHWKGVKIYNDVKEITKEKLEADGVELPDIITGGFPCQPFSVAGKQKGTSDDRHLWPEMFRIIQELKPRWVIGENVKGLVNLQDGMVFETVCTDLEGEGYEVRAFNIPAAGVGAPHRRERIWIVAHRKESMVNADDVRLEQHNETKEETSWWRTSTTFEPTSDVVNTISNGERREISRSDEEERRIQEEHRQDDSSARLTSRTSSIRQTNNGHENASHSESERLQRSRGQESGGNVNGFQQDKERIKSEIRGESERRSRTFGHENVEDSRRTLQSRTELQEKNEDEVGEGYANQHQRSGSSSESNVANTYARLSDGTYEEVQSRGQTLDTSSERVTDVAYTESSDRNDNEAVTRDGGSSTQEVFGNGSSISGESTWWHVEPDVGRVAHGIPGRVYRLKGLGNSIVPKIAEEIGKAIIEAEREE